MVLSSALFVCLFVMLYSTLSALYTLYSIVYVYTHTIILLREERKIKQTFYLKFVTFFPDGIMNVGHTKLLQTLNGDV